MSECVCVVCLHVWECEGVIVSSDFPTLPSSTNLTELAKAIRLLAALNVEGMTPDDLLKAARALAAATAGLLNAAQPENLEVRVEGRWLWQ